MTLEEKLKHLSDYLSLWIDWKMQSDKEIRDMFTHAKDLCMVPIYSHTYTWNPFPVHQGFDVYLQSIIMWQEAINKKQQYEQTRNRRTNRSHRQYQ